jgi:hypothetical protein
MKRRRDAIVKPDDAAGDGYGDGEVAMGGGK